MFYDFLNTISDVSFIQYNSNDTFHERRQQTTTLADSRQQTH